MTHHGFAVQLVPARTLSQVLSGPPLQPQGWAPEAIVLLQRSWPELQRLQSKYRPGFVAFVTARGTQGAKARFLPAEQVRYELRTGFPPCPRALEVLHQAQAGTLIIVVASRLWGVCACGIFDLDKGPFGAEGKDLPS